MKRRRPVYDIQDVSVIKLTAWIAFIAIVVICAIPAVIAKSTRETVIATVRKTERVTVGFGDEMTSKYLIFTDSEVFENTDSPVFWKFNSSDIYGRIEVGKTYRFDVVGYRINVLSSYRNIIEASEYTITE